MGIDAYCFCSCRKQDTNTIHEETFRTTARCFRRLSHMIPENLHPILVSPSFFSHIYDLSEIISMAKDWKLKIEATNGYRESDPNTKMLLDDLNDFIFFMEEAFICGCDKLHFG